MTRIFIDTDDAENYEDIESELEAYNIDFDYDDGGRMMVDDSDVEYPPKYEKDLQIETSSKTGEVIAIKCLNVEKFYGGIINYLMRRADRIQEEIVTTVEKKG